MGLGNNPQALNGGLSLAPNAWPGVPEALLKFVVTMHSALLPGPPLNADVMLEVLNELQLPPPPVQSEPVPQPSKSKDNRSRKKGHGEPASDEDDDEAGGAAQTGEDVFKSRQAAKLRRKT